MAATGACIFASSFSQSTVRHQHTTSAAGGAFKPTPFLASTRRFALSTEHQSSTGPADATPNPIPLRPENELSDSENGRLQRDGGEASTTATTPFMEESESDRGSLKDFFELAKQLVRSGGGEGPPRWFSPLECSSRLDKSPLLLYLPGIDGTGAGLAMQQKRLGKVFDIWCMHIPVMDRTPFTGLVEMVETTIRMESNRCPDQPIYVVGESLGGCIALAVAARNPDIDLVLILANPATSFNESPVKPLVPLLEMMPDNVQLTHPLLLSLIRGDPFKVLKAPSLGDSFRFLMDTAENGFDPDQTVAELSKDLLTMLSYILVLSDTLPKKTLVWKLQMLKSASAFTNSRLDGVKAQTLLLISGTDQLLPSQAEGSRLYKALRGCEIRRFEEKGHFLLLEDDVNLATIIKATSFYRRGKSRDIVVDYLPPTLSEFMKAYESTRWINEITSPVMLSTLDDGTVVRGLAGVPSEGPVLLVGYHMLLGLELVPLIAQFLIERNILVRGIAHPMLFTKYKEGSTLDASFYDNFRLMGAVPVSGSNFFKLFSRKSHVLLYPGGAREALHRKGEEYKLFWPEQAEFVRMAARFGAKIVPFGAVGEDDIGEVVLDYEDLIKIPYLKDQIRITAEENTKLRADATGEVANQDMHLPGILPKVPGRFYYLFGKAIDTAGRKKELKDRRASQELYLEVKSEVENCIAYLKQKREGDPYRSIFSRLMYQRIHGAKSQVPTFEL